MKEAQDCQKSYADLHRTNLEFKVGDHVFFNIPPIRRVMSIGKSGKLSPRYIGPFVILERVSGLAYQLVVPLTLTSTHDVFHISMLKKYSPYASYNLDLSELERVLRTKTIRMVKVLCRNHFL